MTDSEQQTGTTVPTTNFVGSSTGQRIGTDEPTPQAHITTQPNPPQPADNSSPTNERRRTMAGDLPPEALSERLARERKAERERVLRELGIEDPSKYKSEREELAKLRSEREKAERAKLTREQALQADLAKERAQRESIEAQLRESQTARVYDRQETQIQSIVGRHILPSRYKYARTDFIEYLSGLSKRQIARLTERDIDRWFARFAKDNPDFAIARPEEPPEETKPKSSTRKPVNSSPSAAKPAPPPAATNTDPSVVDGKTFRPGQPNSMNKHEVKQAMKRLGLRGW